MTCPSARESEFQLLIKPSRVLRTIPVPDVIRGLYRGGCQCMAVRELNIWGAGRGLWGELRVGTL